MAKDTTKFVGVTTEKKPPQKLKSGGAVKPKKSHKYK